MACDVTLITKSDNGYLTRNSETYLVNGYYFIDNIDILDNSTSYYCIFHENEPRSIISLISETSPESIALQITSYSHTTNNTAYYRIYKNCTKTIRRLEISGGFILDLEVYIFTHRQDKEVLNGTVTLSDWYEQTNYLYKIKSIGIKTNCCLQALCKPNEYVYIKE